MVARKAKRSEGLDSRGKARERGGKGRAGSLSPRPSGRVRAEPSPKSAKLLRIHEALKADRAARKVAVASRLSPEAVSVPQGMVARIARISSGFVVSATFLGPDFQRHEVEASSATFPGALAELASAIASTLGAA